MSFNEWWTGAKCISLYNETHVERPDVLEVEKVAISSGSTTSEKKGDMTGPHTSRHIVQPNIQNVNIWSIITAVPPNFSWRDCIVAAESKRSPKQIKFKDFKFGREDLWRTNISNKTQAHHTAFHLSMIALQSWRRASGDDCLLWWWLLSKSGAAANNCLLISKLVPQPCYPLLWE